MRGQGPVTVLQLASRARKRALRDLNYVHILKQCFKIRKPQMWGCRYHYGFCLHLLLDLGHGMGDMFAHMLNVSVQFTQFSRTYAFATSPQTRATCTM